MPPMLPLPMAALVSLTITFKLDKSVEYIHGVVGQALENCATGCTWPSMPIIGALWTQKVRRWHDFIVLSCSRSPFSRDKDAVAQLIRSCFTAFLGPSVVGGSHITAHRGVNGLLGQFMSDQGVRLPIAPGFLYLRTCRTFHDTHFVNEVIFKLVIEWAHKLANEWASGGPAHLKSSQISLAAAASRVQQVATLGTCLLCIAGGVEMVQVLYEETLPTILLSAGGEKLGGAGPVSNILQGYAMAYMLILCGTFVWGVGNTSPAYTSVFSSRRARVIGIHMDFVTGAVEGNILLRCDPATWKAYVSCFVGLLVKFAPAWVHESRYPDLDSRVAMAFGCLTNMYMGMRYLISVGTCHLQSIKIKCFLSVHFVQVLEEVLELKLDLWSVKSPGHIGNPSDYGFLVNYGNLATRDSSS
ncbi:hypothetical protein B296_00058357 [Ensete ventricosum]|uniref:ABC transmembrane type-1 domain-containing protein n=1 Tax=Ensete ventricosum TaxID=4639 RepID=A0A426XMG6_ENSVE|nr:hypothetical protein B296_00058357 [Ensete ventricosum]